MADKSNKPDIEFRRKEDFKSIYANHAFFETSVWDLKIIFGQLNQHEKKQVIEQDVSVTIPWLQAKLMSIYLQINIVSHEALNGKINIPEDLLPNIPLIEKNASEDPQAMAFFEAVRNKIEQIVADL
jgi:hypothetical protein